MGVSRVIPSYDTFRTIPLRVGRGWVWVRSKYYPLIQYSRAHKIPLGERV